MKITSTVFENNEIIPVNYTCDGENINPPLVILDVPQNAKSLSLIMEDPDAPDEPFTHWLMWNIDPITEDIEAGETPEGAVEGLNSSGEKGYIGPCPPTNSHHYIFKLFALDTTIDLPFQSDKENLLEKMEGHIIDQSELTGFYSRQVID